MLHLYCVWHNFPGRWEASHLRRGALGKGVQECLGSPLGWRQHQIPSLRWISMLASPVKARFGIVVGNRKQDGKVYQK